MSSQDQVAAAATARGLDVEVRASRRARGRPRTRLPAIGCDVAQIVKSLVFVVDDEPVVALVGGSDRLDERKLASAAGGAHRAGPTPTRCGSPRGTRSAAFRPSATRRSCGVSSTTPLLAHDVVWAAAGTPTHVFSSRPTALVAAAGAEVATLRQ